MNNKIILVVVIIVGFSCTEEKGIKDNVSITEVVQADTMNENLIKKDTTQNYLNLVPPGNVPEKFAPQIIKLKGTPHIIIAFHPNGREIYWLPTGLNGIKSNIIRFVKYENGSWSEIRTFKPSEEYGAVSLHISPDGQRLYFLSQKPSHNPSRGPFNVWYYERDSNWWGEPKQLDSKLNNILGLSSTMDGTLYTHGIKRAKLTNGKYSDWETVSQTLNINEGTGGVPFVSPDERFILFGQEKPSKMYISYKDELCSKTSKILNNYTIIFCS